MIPKFRAWVKPNILSNHLDGVIAEAKPDFLGRNCLVRRNDLEGKKCFTEIFAFDDIELMQSTGLKDKNGVEIFEWDIVLVNVSNGFDHLVNEKTVVQESEFHSGLICKSLASGMEYRVFKHKKMGYEYEVIGNIYENSELLEEQ